MTRFSTHVLALSALFLFLPACGATQPPEPSPVPAPAAATTPPPEPTTPVAASTGAPEASVEPVTPVASSSPPPGKPGKEKAFSANHAPEAAPAVAAPAGTTAGGDAPPADACTTENFHYSQIGSACHSGGRKAAKEVMKGVVKKANAAGADLKCGSCHEDLNTFHLKANAVTDLKQWL